MKHGVSVIICCFNGAARLPETLSQLSRQEMPPDVSWEIIVIDNASTDDTARLALDEWKKYAASKIEFTVLTEKRPGKSFAIKTGADSARFEFLLICDDDNWLSPDYIANAIAIMDSDDRIGVLGGCGIFHPEQPAWTEIENYKTAYVNGSQTWAASDHWVYGAGSLCRTEVLKGFFKNGWQPIISGRTSNKLVCSEDVEICFMFYLNGYKIISDDRLLFRHFVPLKRQNLKYILKLRYWQAYSYVLLTSYLMLLREEKESIHVILNAVLINTSKALLVESIKFRLASWRNRKKLSFGQRATLITYYATGYSIARNKNKIIKHYNLLKTFKSKFTANEPKNE